MTQTGGVVIVGAGQAGAELAGFLRQRNYAGRITLLGEERHLPYRRPPLSKTFLSGEVTRDSLHLRSSSAYEEQRIDCRPGVKVESIDRDAHRVRLSDGKTLPYEKLVLATGGRARRLSLCGADAANVHYIRTIDDIVKLKEQFKPDCRLVIIGGGFIGLEAASVGVKRGLHVTVVEALPRVLVRVTAPEMSAFYERVHRKHGVNVRTGVEVRTLEPAERVGYVVLDDGTRLPADLVIVGIGLIPNTELAGAAGLDVANGIMVDGFLLTGDPDIYAIGDCANHINQFLDQRLRLESVPNATEQARAVAGSICGAPTAYSAVPWFWSDQYDLKLQMAGLSQGYDQMVVRGDMESEAFCVFYLRDGMLIGADAVNRPAEFMLAKKLIAQHARPTEGQLADEKTPLKLLAQPTTAV